MAPIRLRSVDDPAVDEYRRLTRPQGKRSGWPWFVVEGRWLTERLLQSDLQVCSLLLEEKAFASLRELIPPAVPAYLVSAAEMRRIVGFDFHRGVLARGRRPVCSGLQDLVRSNVERQTIAICPDVADPENLGGILRSAAAFGIGAVLLGAQAADAFARRTLRVSMGAAFRLRIHHSSNLLADLAALRDEFRFDLVASVLDVEAGHLASRDRRGARVGLLFGSEAAGLAPACREICRDFVTISMSEGVDSLNVAAAASIFFYHFTHVARVVC